MRGKKTALAIVVLMLLAGGLLNHYMPDYDAVADAEQTQVTEGAGASVK